MRITKIILNNIGIFAGKNVLDFHNSNEKPIILIGGLNGRGKTTILESILFALYGKRVCKLLEGNWKYEEYLERLGNYLNSDDMNYVELSFYIDREDKKEEYVIKREWSHKNKKVKVYASRDGYIDKVLSVNWDMFIEEVIPLGIAPFFFFDGEKISELAASEDDGPLTESIKNLLGINIIQQALWDIDTLVKNKQKEIKSTEYQDLAHTYFREIENLKSKADALKSEENEVVKKIEDETARSIELEEKFVISGGTLLKQKKEMENRKMQIERELAFIYDELRLKAADSLPLFLVKPLLADIFVRTKEEEKNRNKDIVIKELPALYDEFTKGKEKKDSIEAFLEYLQTNSLKEDAVYNLSGEGLIQLERIMNNMEKEEELLKKELMEADRKKKELEDIENQLLIHIDEQSVSDIYSAIKDVTAAIAVLKVKLDDIRQQKEAAIIALERKESEYQKILDKAANEMDIMDDLRRIIDYALKEKKVLGEYKKRMQKLKAAELGNMITSCFEQIAAKSGLISKVVIDEKSLQFKYYSGHREISKNSLSAGEKQLLVTAILWGLGICSKKELPIIIDTPLGRLDSLHRQTLITNYFPKASKQMIILSTDQEITKQDYGMLKKYIEREYTLFYDEQTNSSSIKEGYFGG